jgi:predicted secreted protein
MILGRGRSRPRPIPRVMQEYMEVTTAEPFFVVLPENGPGGYLWRISELPPAISVRREDDLPPGEAAPGATGTKLFELEAREPGTFTVRFERRRDWEPGADRERSVVVSAR